jgi:chromosome partitioning protein
LDKRAFDDARPYNRGSIPAYVVASKLPRVYAVVNQKGGVGKTTTAINVAANLPELGKSGLIVDMDPQGNTTSGLGFSRSELSRSVYNVIVDAEDINEIIRPTGVSGLDILPSHPSLAGAEIELISLPRRERRLLYALEALRIAYDYVIIDCPPSLGLLTVNCLVAAEFMLIPIQCEYYALEGLGALTHTSQLIQRELNPRLKIGGIVLTLYDPRTTLALQVAQQVRAQYPEKTFRTVIPRNVRLSEAPSHGMPISQYDPTSRGAIAYQELTKELIAR